MVTQRPRRPLAHSEVLRSCCVVTLRVPNTCVFAPDFDFPGDDAPRCSARDCTKASWRNPIAQQNRTSVAGCVMLPLKFVARAFQAIAPHCFPTASSASLFAVVVECRVRRPLNSAQRPSRHAGNRRVAERAIGEFVSGALSSAKPNTASPVPPQASMGRS